MATVQPTQVGPATLIAAAYLKRRLSGHLYVVQMLIRSEALSPPTDISHMASPGSTAERSEHECNAPPGDHYPVDVAAPR